MESVLYQTCAKSLREHDAIDVYKKAIDEVASQSPGGRSGSDQRRFDIVRDANVFVPGPNNLDDVVNASRRRKSKRKSC